MFMKWRWDQGRLTYFNFNNLRIIANIIQQFNGIELNSEDFIRNPLVNATGLPFSPETYSVWRNYKRVFECSLLATSSNGRLVASDLCKEFNRENGFISNVDDYFSWYIPRFRYPFPAFKEYNCNESSIFPFCSLLKYLVALKRQSLEAKITLADVFSILIANSCTGFEEVEYYYAMNRQSVQYSDVEKRQVREMLIFLSQASIFKWFNDSLYLDVSRDDIDTPEFMNLLRPFSEPPLQSKFEDFLSLTSYIQGSEISTKLHDRENAADEIFIEGNRTRVTHLRIERSPLLRTKYIEKNPDPVCNMCGQNMFSIYPWTTYLIEMHHVMPLSSAIMINTNGTSLDDMIGLCPSCHRSIHIYYRNYLNSLQQDDFLDKDEARQAYLEAKERVTI